MGRPRKRRAVEEPEYNDVTATNSTASQPSQNIAASNLPAELPAAPVADYIPQIDDGAGVNYLDMLPNTFGDNDSASLFSFPQQSYPSIFEQDGDGHDNNGFTITGGDILQSFDFSEDVSTSGVSKDINDSFVQFMTTQPAATSPSPFEETPPSISSGISYTDETHEPETCESSTLKPIPVAICGCLSSLYLALESLTHLPEDVPSAMRVARSATKVAQDVIECPHCSNSFFKDPLKPQPVQAFQNMMFLGALVPSACNAYAHILELIDRDTDRAKKNNKELYFSFKEVGGLWGHVIDDQGSCSALQAYNNKHLYPEIWRTTVRSILKLDIYGLGGKSGISPGGKQLQRGLKDIVDQLECTSRRRHEIADELFAAGQLPSHSRYIMHAHMPCPPEQRNCVRVIESARMALNNLVIS